MNRIKKLAQAYARHIALPWREDAAPAQRIIFCIYNAAEERILRANIAEFEIATTSAGHSWLLFDLGGTFAKWLSAQKYAEKYFQNPARLNALALDRYLDWIVENYEAAIPKSFAQAGMVVALTGIAELFGFLKVKNLLDKLEPRISGRLAVFFPGSHDGNNYRLLDAYDGWNYLAVPLTADM
ncbi:MAG: DUF1788 domain-containing protein [Desulfovibrio sp.]|nr:DUF1788 domain-containing protein [Desulfovibrio sp.]